MPAGATWTVTGTTETVRIPGSAPGTWQLSLVGIQLDAQGEPVQVFASTAQPAPTARPAAAATVTVLDRRAGLIHVDGTGSTSANGPITS